MVMSGNVSQYWIGLLPLMAPNRIQAHVGDQDKECLPFLGILDLWKDGT